MPVSGGEVFDDYYPSIMTCATRHSMRGEWTGAIRCSMGGEWTGAILHSPLSSHAVSDLSQSAAEI